MRLGIKETAAIIAMNEDTTIWQDWGAELGNLPCGDEGIGWMSIVVGASVLGISERKLFLESLRYAVSDGTVSIADLSWGPLQSLDDALSEGLLRGREWAWLRTELKKGGPTAATEIAPTVRTSSRRAIDKWREGEQS